MQHFRIFYLAMVLMATNPSQVCDSDVRNLDDENLRPEVFDEWICKEPISVLNTIFFEELNEKSSLICG